MIRAILNLSARKFLSLPYTRGEEAMSPDLIPRRLWKTTSPTPSVMSHIKRRIEALELDACVVSGELPVDLGLDSVSGRLPGGDLGA